MSGGPQWFKLFLILYRTLLYKYHKAVQRTAIFLTIVFLEHFVFLSALNPTKIVHYHWSRMGK